MKAFAYVNPTNEKDAVAALAPEFEKALPIGGGQDLLARMKDYITQPDRLVNVKDALDSTVTPRQRRPADRRGDEDGRSRRARRGRAAVSRDRRGGDRSRHAADPQPGHRRRQPQPAAALLVLPQRGVRLLQEGRQHAASRSRARTSSTPSSAADRASSCTRRASRCRWSPTARRSASSGRKASGWCRRRTTSRCRRENVRTENVLAPNELLTHVILPAPGNVKSGHYEVRYKTSHDWPIAFATVLLAMNGSTVQSARVVLGAVAPIPWRSPAAEQALAGKTITEETAAAAAEAALQGAQPLSENAYKVQVAKTAVKRAILRAAGIQTV